MINNEENNNKKRHLKVNNFTIYKIYSNYCDNFYIGSTTNYYRKTIELKTSCNNPNNKNYNFKMFENIRNNGGWINWIMVQLETINNITKIDAEQKEEEWKHKLNNQISYSNNYEDKTINNIEISNQNNYQENNDFLKYDYYIYKIYSDNCKDFYIGSTRNVIKKRNSHKQYYYKNDKNYNLKIYDIIRNNGGWENWNLKIIDNIKNITKLEAQQKEEEWRQKLLFNNITVNNNKIIKKVELDYDNNEILNDYIIYKIYSDYCADFYIGSTKNIHKRKISHKTRCNNPNDSHYNLKIYNSIRDNGGWEKWKIIEIDNFENVSKRYAQEKEEEYRLKLNANLNSQRAFITNEQKIQINKEYNKKYIEINKEELKIKNKNYREENKEKVKEQKHNEYINNKEKYQESMKIYREENKEKIKEQKHNEYLRNRTKYLERTKKYKEENKELIKQKRCEKIQCSCGVTFSRNDKARHEHSLAHQNYVKSDCLNI
tara:strand:+ start:338 stop:1801 length:1464 start_codon:yes stop_codon:yes gene_type:complete